MVHQYYGKNGRSGVGLIWAVTDQQGSLGRLFTSISSPGK